MKWIDCRAEYQTKGPHCPALRIYFLRGMAGRGSILGTTLLFVTAVVRAYVGMGSADYAAGGSGNIGTTLNESDLSLPSL